MLPPRPPEWSLGGFGVSTLLTSSRRCLSTPCPWESDASTIVCRVYLQSHNLIIHCFMALHDTKPVDCLALGTDRHRRSSERSEIIALHSLSQGIVIEHVTLSHQSHWPVLHLLLHAFLPSLLHLLTYLRFCASTSLQWLDCQYSL